VFIPILEAFIFFYISIISSYVGDFTTTFGDPELYQALRRFADF
jgi:hypothetical protein